MRTVASDSMRGPQGCGKPCRGVCSRRGPFRALSGLSMGLWAACLAIILGTTAHAAAPPHWNDASLALEGGAEAALSSGVEPPATVTGSSDDRAGESFRELLAQRGDSGGTASSSAGASTQNPPGFYVPVRPEYEGRTFTVRATAFTSNEDLLSLSLGYNRHPIFDLEFGLWANPLWCSDFIDRCRPGKDITAWGAFLQYGISRQLADQRGIRQRAWSFEVPFHLEFRYLNGDNVSTVLWGVHIGIEFIRWFRPSTGLALKLTAGSPFVDMRTWNLQQLNLNFRGSVGITF